MYDDPDKGIEDDIESVQHTMLVECLGEGPGVNTKAARIYRVRGKHVIIRNFKRFKV